MIGAILLIAFLLAFATSGSFRKLSLAVAACLTILLIVFIGADHAKEEESRKLVTADQLSFTDVRLGREYSGSYHLVGRVKNNSHYEVVGIQCKFHLLDCDSANQCDTIGDESHGVLLDVLPPGQARDIDTTIYFGDAKPRQQFQWNYSVKEINARAPSH